MKSFRALLTVLLLLLAQAGAMAHAVEHWYADNAVSQECAVCLAGHGPEPDCAPPAPCFAAALSTADYSPPEFNTFSYAGVLRIFRRARAPPSARLI